MANNPLVESLRRAASRGVEPDDQANPLVESLQRAAQAQPIPAAAVQPVAATGTIGPLPDPGIIQRIGEFLFGGVRTGETPLGRLIPESIAERVGFGGRAETGIVDPTELPFVRPEAFRTTPGLVRGALGEVGRFTTAPNALLIGGTAGLGAMVTNPVARVVLQRLVAAGFGIDLLVNTARQAPELVDAIERGDETGAREILGEMAVRGAAGVGASAFALRGGRMAQAREPAAERPVRGLLPAYREPIITPPPPGSVPGAADTAFVRGVPAEYGVRVPQARPERLLAAPTLTESLPVQAARLPEPRLPFGLTLEEAGQAQGLAPLPTIRQARALAKPITPREAAALEQRFREGIAAPIREAEAEPGSILRESLGEEGLAALRENLRGQVREAVQEEVRQAVQEETGIAPQGIAPFGAAPEVPVRQPAPETPVPSTVVPLPKPPTEPVVVARLQPSGLGPTDSYFNRPELTRNETYAWRAMGEKEFQKLMAGDLTYKGGVAGKANFFAPTPESAAQYGGKGRYLVEFAGVKLGDAENILSPAGRDNVTFAWRHDGKRWQPSPLPAPREPLGAVEQEAGIAPPGAEPFALQGEQARKPLAPEAALPGLEPAIEEQRAGAARAVAEAMKGEDAAIERRIAREEGFYLSPKERERRIRTGLGRGLVDMQRLRSGTPDREEIGLPPLRSGKGELFSNPVFSPRFWERADTVLREKVTRPLAQKISRAVGKLPDGLQRWLLSDFGRFPEVKRVFQESRTEIGRVKSEAEALQRIWLRTKPTPEETVAAERILRGQPEDLNKLRPEQREAVGEIRAAAQRLTGERQALGLSVREEWLEGPRHWWPNFFRKHLGQSIGGRLFGRIGGRAKPSRESLGSLKPRLSDRYWVADASGDLVETTGGARAVFTSRQTADAFVRDNSGFSVSYFQKGGQGLSRRTFPTLRERTAWIKKQGDSITVRKLESRHLQVVEPMSFEQQVANGLVLDPKLNIALGWSRQAELVAKTRFLSKLGEMEGVVRDTPAEGYVRLDELGFSVPASLAERNPAIARLREGFVYEPLAKELAAFYGTNSPFQIAYRVAEGELRKWVTYRNPWRHPRQIFENELTTALTDSGAFLDKIDQGRAFREYARAAAGDRTVRWWKEYAESELISTDLIRGEFQTMWRGLSEAVGLKPNAPLSLTERLALWAETNPLARRLLQSDEFAQRAYRNEDQIYKAFRYRRYRNQGWEHEAAVKRVKDSYFDYNSADIPRIVRVANRYIPFWINVSYQYARIFANQLRDYPASTMLRLAVLWYAQAFVRDLMFQKSGLTEQDMENLGDYGPKAWEFVLPWTDEKGRNLVLNLQWFVPFSEVALMRHAAITETPERGFSQLVRRFVPMVGQPVATIATQRTAFGQPVLKGTESRKEAVWKLARAAALSAMPALLGQYWERLFRNAEAGEATKRPLAEKALLEPALGRIERFNVEERVGLRQAIAAGRGRDLSEEAGKLRGRLLRGQISGETFRSEVRKLHARTSDPDVAHPDVLAIVKALEANRDKEARAGFKALLDSGFFRDEGEAADAVSALLDQRERLHELQSGALPEAVAAVRAVADEFRRTGRVSKSVRDRLVNLLERLPDADAEALGDWLEEQLSVRPKRAPAKSGSTAPPIAFLQPGGFAPLGALSF